jgi:ketosteroid isomerase-like protein
MKSKTSKRASVVKLSRVALALGISFVAFMSTANTKAQKLPPLPVNDKDFPKALIPVVEAEHAFATYSIEHGMKEAFMSYAALNGLIIRRKPVNAIEAWTQTNPAPTGLLTWYPIYADVSRAGDLGWTTGPWEFREKASDKEASGNGHFVTLWRKQADGVWKFEMDFGVSHAAPTTKETVLQYPPELRKSAGGGKADISVDAARGSLLEAESALTKEAAAKSSARAFLAQSDASVRLYRQNNYPIVGKEEVARFLEAKADAVTWHATNAGVARSVDLGYAYGTYELRAKPTDEKPTEIGNYMRIWRRHGDKWHVVLEVTNPIPPPPPPAQ